MMGAPERIYPTLADCRSLAPSEEDLPQFPPSWYRFGPSRQVSTKPHTRTLLGRELVAYRTVSGKPVVMDARCAHLGADLGRGTVRGENIQCPFHGWEYGTSGDCVHIPGEATLPPFARQVVYPVQERLGSLYFFNGVEPLFPLPFFFDEDPDAYVAGRPFEILAECPWYMLAANGFDVSHFNVVHDRTMIDAPWVDAPAPYATRMNYRAEVTGDSVFDAFLRRTVGGIVKITITNWGGAYILVTGDFPRARSRILIATQPLGPSTSKAEIIVHAPRRNVPLAGLVTQFLSLEFRRLFTQAFMKHDEDRLPGIVYRPQSLLASESELVNFFTWLAALPQSTIQAPCAFAGGSHNGGLNGTNGTKKPCQNILGG